MPRKRLSLWIDFVLVMCIWTAVVLTLVLIIPEFTTVFEDFGGELPSLTMAIVHLSRFMQSWWIPVTLPCLLAAVAFHFWRLRRVSREASTMAASWDRYVSMALIAIGAILFLLVVLAIVSPTFTIGDVVSGT